MTLFAVILFKEDFMERDLGDILDRQSIAKLKAARIGLDENIRKYEAFSNRISKQYD